MNVGGKTERKLENKSRIKRKGSKGGREEGLGGVGQRKEK